jgi:uncharacterized membrane protein
LLEDIRLGTKRSWDLSLIFVLSLLLALFIYAVPDNPIRVLIGLPFILFFPGYALVVILFPENRSLEVIGRMALSAGLSIAVVPLVGYGLNFTSYGIRLEPLMWSLIAVDLVFCTLGLWRRSRATDPFLPFKVSGFLAATKKNLKSGKKFDSTFTIVLVIAIIASVVGLVYITAVPREGQHFSEFYVLGSNNTEIDYPHNLTVGENASVVLGIANHEQRIVNYTVEVWLANTTFADNVTNVHQLFFLDDFSVVLDSVPTGNEVNWTPEWQGPYGFSVPQAGAYKIWFVLLPDGTPFLGVKNQDYAGTPSQDRFLSIIDSKGDYSLNLNLIVSA